MYKIETDSQVGVDIYQRGGSTDVLLRVTVGVSVAETSGRAVAGRPAKDLDSGIGLHRFNCRHQPLLSA